MSQETPNVFEMVPIENTAAWRKVKELTFRAVYTCGHPRGGCPRHCDVFMQIAELAEERLADAGQASVSVSQQTREQVINKMVDRFLQWRLPENFVPDCGISFKKPDRPYAEAAWWPVAPDAMGVAFRILESFSNVLSKLESQISRNPDLPEAYKTILREGYETRSKIQWLLSNLCPRHQEVASMSSGPCPFCEAAGLRSQAAPTPQEAPFFDQLAIDLARETHGRFVMGGWSPADMHAELINMLQQWWESREQAAPASTPKIPPDELSAATDIAADGAGSPTSSRPSLERDCVLCGKPMTFQYYCPDCRSGSGCDASTPAGTVPSGALAGIEEEEPILSPALLYLKCIVCGKTIKSHDHDEVKQCLATLAKASAPSDGKEDR